VLITLTAKIFSGSHTKESRARMRNKPNNPPLETTQAPSAPPIFDPRKGVELTDAFGQLKRIVGPRDVGNKHTVKYFNRKVHAGELELILVRPDGTYREFDAAEHQKLNIRVPLNYEEGCSIEPYFEEGRWYVRCSDLDKLTTSPAARAEESMPGPASPVEPVVFDNPPGVDIEPASPSESLATRELPEEPQLEESRKWRPNEVRTWFKSVRKTHPQKPGENKSAYARRLHNHMKDDFEGDIPWGEPTLRRRLND
jgi:hypothetical protein